MRRRIARREAAAKHLMRIARLLTSGGARGRGPKQGRCPYGSSMDPEVTTAPATPRDDDCA